MSGAERRRKENKHRQVVLVRSGQAFLVEKTVNTLKPTVGSIVDEIAAQNFIDDGYTVTTKRSKH